MTTLTSKEELYTLKQKRSIASSLGALVVDSKAMRADIVSGRGTRNISEMLGGSGYAKAATRKAMRYVFTHPGNNIVKLLWRGELMEFNP